MEAAIEEKKNMGCIESKENNLSALYKTTARNPDVIRNLILKSMASRDFGNAISAGDFVNEAEMNE